MGCFMAIDLSRRAVLAGIASAIGTSLIGCDPDSRSRNRNPNHGGSSEQPNILVLLADDPGPQFFGAYGDALASTPNVDRLANDGILFKNFFATSPVCAPTRFGILTGMHAESCGPAHHMRAEGKSPDWLMGFPGYLQETGYWTSYTGKEDYNADFTERAGYDATNANPIGNFFESFEPPWNARPEGAPFFSFVNYVTCHEFSGFVPRPVLVLPTQVEVPPYLPDSLLQRTQLAGYYNNVAQTDIEIGLFEDTIIIFFSDHGGILPRSKRFCYDSGCRVPMIMRFPEKWQHLAPAAPGTVIDEPATTVDIGPTVLSLAGLSIPDYMHGQAFAGPQRRIRKYAFAGRNRMDERYDFIRSVRSARFRYIRNYLPQLIYGQHVAFMWMLPAYRDWELQWTLGLLNEEQSRFWMEKPAEELYDLESDPDEVRNLIDDPAYSEVTEELRDALNLHMVSIHDNGFIPEGATAEGFDQSRAAGAYPLMQVMSLAELATRRDPQWLPVFQNHMSHENEVMRFWAVMGAIMLGQEAVPLADSLQQLFSNDETIHVRIAAAEALVRVGQAGDAVQFLADTFKGTQPKSVRLQAINALTNIGNAAQPALVDITLVAVTEQDIDLRNAALYLSQVLSGTYTPLTTVYAGVPFA